MATDAITERLAEFFRTRSHDFAVVYLFGSVARGDASPSSDVDLAVIRARPAETPLERLNAAVAGELERIVGRPVEIVDLELAPVDLGHRVLRDGRIVFESDPGGDAGQSAILRFDTSPRALSPGAPKRMTEARAPRPVRPDRWRRPRAAIRGAHSPNRNLGCAGRGLAHRLRRATG